MEASTTTAPLPVLDGKYQLLRRLGEGGMGTVYEARHNGTGRRVAVKVIASAVLEKGGDVVGRFQREAMASGAIESQYIAHVMDTGIDSASGSPYMVMELLVGEDLEQTVKRLGPLAPEVVLRIGAQACLGLQKAHDAGVIHRDIKPANLYLTRRDGGELVVKLVDFGIAKMKVDQVTSTEGKSLTRTGSLMGSPLYMSPEQAFGKKTIDHRTDVWSLGVVMYEAMTGITPHGDAETVGELLVRICSVPSRVVQERAPWVTPEVTSIIHRALALDPNARYASASEMFAAIKAALHGGYALDEAMLAPLSDATKATRAPRVSLPEAVRAPSPSSTDLSEFAATGQAVVPNGGGTIAGLGRTGGGEADEAPIVPKSSPVVPLAIAGVVAALGIGLGAWALATRSGATAGAATPTVLVAPPTWDSASATAPPPPPPAVAERTVRLVVMPVNALVDVDGLPATQTGGAVSIKGALGSTHHVKLSLDGREKLTDVVIADDGPLPALVELGSAPVKPATTHAPAAAPAAPAKPAKPVNPLEMQMQ